MHSIKTVLCAFGVAGGLLSPLLAAGCPEHDRVFDQAVSEGQYDKVLTEVSHDLHLGPAESKTLQVMPGLQEINEGSNAKADPDKNEVSLDPRLFLEGMPNTCQAVAHELQHLRQFRWDRQTLHSYYSAASTSYRTAWDGCSVSGLAQDPATLEQTAFDCLEDDKLATHAAVFEIDGVLHQVPYAPRGLIDDDRDYLLKYLLQFSDHLPQWQNPSNEAYYLLAIKRKDRAIFCQGVRYARQQNWDIASWLQTYAALCGGLHPVR